MRVALDHLGRHGRWLGWGPARHGVGGNIASYVRIVEEECFVELYCDMEQLQPDHQPRRWPDDRFSSNTWGPLPPRSYFRFDARGDRIRARQPRDARVPLRRLLLLLHPLRSASQGDRMTLQGYTVPRTPRGQRQPGAAAALALRRRLPRRRLPRRPGRGRLAAAGGARATPGRRPLRRRVRRLAVLLGGRRRADRPVRSQYREFYLVVSGLLDGEPVTTCPFIWVDQDFALARGWIQGFPKKLGDVWMTRDFGLDCKAAPGIAPARASAPPAPHAAASSRATVLTLEHESETGSPHTDPPLVNVRHFPRLSRRPPRRAAGPRARARPQPRPQRLGDLGGRRQARAVRGAGRGAHAARSRSASPAATASPSPTPSTTSRPSRIRR